MQLTMTPEEFKDWIDLMTPKAQAPARIGNLGESQIDTFETILDLIRETSPEGFRATECADIVRDRLKWENGTASARNPHSSALRLSPKKPTQRNSGSASIDRKQRTTLLLSLKEWVIMAIT